jgi:hypothetical protein
MPVNPNFSTQGTPVPGGYAQPASGVTEQIETPADPSGNAYATELASGGTAILEEGLYRDTIVTAQAGGKQTSPTAGTVIATVTPGTAGKWEIWVNLAITGTTTAAADSNNFALNQTATPLLSPISFPVNGTTGAPNEVNLPPIIANLSGVDTVNVTAVANATASAVYSANIVCRRVG